MHANIAILSHSSFFSSVSLCCFVWDQLWFFFAGGFLKTKTSLIQKNTPSLDLKRKEGRCWTFFSDKNKICPTLSFISQSHLLLCSLQQVKKLQAILKPMMLRRLKDDVEKNLAPKEETIIEVGLCVYLI